MFVETPRPVSVEVWAREGARIDANSINAPVPPTSVDRAHRTGSTSQARSCRRTRPWAPSTASQGRTFTFELDLPPGVKRIVLRVTVVWTSMRWALGPDAKVADCPSTTRFSGTVGDVPYVVASETPFRVVTRWVLASASVLLSERTERE